MDSRHCQACKKPRPSRRGDVEHSTRLGVRTCRAERQTIVVAPRESRRRLFSHTPPEKNVNDSRKWPQREQSLFFSQQSSDKRFRRRINLAVSLHLYVIAYCVVRAKSKIRLVDVSRFGEVKSDFLLSPPHIFNEHELKMYEHFTISFEIEMLLLHVRIFFICRVQYYILIRAKKM